MARVDISGVSIRARRRQRRALEMGLVIFLLVVLAAAIVGLTNAPAVRIRTIDVFGTKTVTPQDIQDQIRRALSGSYFFIVPKDSIFFYSRGGLASAVLASHPTLKEVSVRAESFSSISVSAVDRQPRALWCPVASAGNDCVLLDEDGVAYAKAPQGDVGFAVYQGGTAGALPWQFLSQEQFGALAALVDALGSIAGDNPVVRVAVDGNLDAHAYFQNGFELLFTLKDQGGDTFERFKLALSADPFKAHPLTDFAYLDLRFGDKLYYKLK